MSSFAIKYPFFILMFCLMVVVVGTANQFDDWVFASPFTSGVRPYWARVCSEGPYPPRR
jgi:hypothetical protein